MSYIGTMTSLSDRIVMASGLHRLSLDERSALGT